jgi:hypothetical protein
MPVELAERGRKRFYDIDWISLVTRYTYRSYSGGRLLLRQFASIRLSYRISVSKAASVSSDSNQMVVICLAQTSWILPRSIRSRVAHLLPKKKELKVKLIDSHNN